MNGNAGNPSWLYKAHCGKIWFAVYLTNRTFGVEAGADVPDNFTDSPPAAPAAPVAPAAPGNVTWNVTMLLVESPPDATAGPPSVQVVPLSVDTSKSFITQFH